jgi:phage-related protein
MASSIYNIPNWAASTKYDLYDIVKNGNYFYYCIVPHTSTASFDATKFNGTITDNAETKPYFFWKPSYNSEASMKPRAKSIKFGDGYEQRAPDGINNVLLAFDLSFATKRENEATAILHFLHVRAAWESFVFNAPNPYNVNKRYVCREWTPSFIFKDNFTIRATFEEVPN